MAVTLGVALARLSLSSSTGRIVADYYSPPKTEAPSIDSGFETNSEPSAAHDLTSTAHVQTRTTRKNCQETSFDESILVRARPVLSCCPFSPRTSTR